MSLYDKRLQREELSDRLDFLTVEDRDRVPLSRRILS